MIVKITSLQALAWMCAGAKQSIEIASISSFSTLVLAMTITFT